MGGMAIVFYQKEKRLIEERYLNVDMRRNGFLPHIDSFIKIFKGSLG